MPPSYAVDMPIRLPSVENRPKFLAVILLVIAWFVFFSPIIFAGKVYFSGDIKDIYYPLEHAYGEFQRDATLPVWSNEFGFGHPLIAWGQLGFFTPVHILLRFLQIHPLWVINLSMMVYFALGLAGMFMFLRVRKFSYQAATLGSALFVFNGFVIGHLLHVNFYTSVLLLPWLLLAIELLLTRPTMLRMIMLTLVAAAITLSGQPQVILLTFIMAGIAGIALFIERFPQVKHQPKLIVLQVGSIIAAGVLAFGLSSFAILPLLEFLPVTERSDSLPPEELYEFSYPPQHAMTLIAPNFFGSFDDYRGAKSREELSAFVGILPLLLAVLGALWWRGRRAERTTGIALVAIALLMAPGEYSPIYRYLVEQHILTSLGVPGRYVYFFVIGITLLASIGVNNLTELRWKSFKAPALWLLVCISLATTLMFATTYHPLESRGGVFTSIPFRDYMRTYSEQTKIPPRLYSRPALASTAAPNLLLPVGTSISPTFSIRQEIVRDEIQKGCIFIPFYSESTHESHSITISLHEDLTAPPKQQRSINSQEIQKNPEQEVCFDEWLNEQSGASFLSITSDQASGISTYVTSKKQAEDPGVYLIRVAEPSRSQLADSEKDFRLGYNTRQQLSLSTELAVLNRHTQVTANASSARWIGALSIRPYREFIEKFFANDSTQLVDGDGQHFLERERHIVDMTGITHLAQMVPPGAKDRLPDLGFTIADEFRDGETLFRLYKNPQAYPKAFIVPNAKFIAAADETRHALMDPQFNPRELVYLSGPTPPELRPQTTEPLDASAVIRHYSPTRVDVEVSTNMESYLVVTDSTVPQWQTYIDDQPALQLTANSVFKAAQVPPGEHVVSFRYESPAIRRATLLTTIAAAIIVSILGVLGIQSILDRKRQAA